MYWLIITANIERTLLNKYALIFVLENYIFYSGMNNLTSKCIQIYFSSMIVYVVIIQF